MHLGQHDASVAFAREVLGTQKIVGRSTTNKQELNRAIAEKADYVGVGTFLRNPNQARQSSIDQ